MPSLPTRADPISTTKASMRQEISRLRDDLGVAQRMAETMHCLRQLQTIPAYQSARTVLCTMSFGSEMDTRDVIKNAQLTGKRVALPRVDARSQTLQLFWFDGDTALQRSRWGIDEPTADANTAPIEEIEMVLVPGLAFDHCGNRLGYGRGYYDRLLSSTQSTTQPTTKNIARIAIAFSCQVVPAVPTHSYDERIDTLITIMGTTHFPAATRSNPPQQQ